MRGAIEAGGTKFVLGIGDEKGNIFETKSFPTLTPNETMKNVVEYFKDKEIEGIGIASFGPIDINKKSDTYGFIKDTPKKHWSNFNFLGTLKKEFPDLKYTFNTDVNYAGLGEFYMGNGIGKDSLLYITVGTGFGGGYIYKGNILRGLGHPEMGHIKVIPNPRDDYKGSCPYHDYCLEGMACGFSIEDRYGIKGNELEDTHEIWDFISDYIAQGIMAFTVICRPENITIGGGVMNTPGLIEKVKDKFLDNFNSYLEIPNIDSYITLPRLGANSAIHGALLSLDMEENL